VIFDEKSIPRQWYDAADDLIDHNRHMTEEIGSVKWWTYKIRTDIVPCTFMFQVRMFLTLPGLVAQVDYYAGSEVDSQNAAHDAANIHDDLAIHMSTYTDAKILERSHH
jgi:hypothetical protein